MKNSTLLIILAVVLHLGAMSQNQPIKGLWLLTNAEQNKKSEDVYMILNFDGDGTLKINDEQIGTWKVSDDYKSISLSSEYFKQIEGEYKPKLSVDQMTLANDNITLHFNSINKNDIITYNEKSQLAGSWVIPDKNMHIILMLNLPDDFTIIEEESEGVISKYSGNWIYDDENNSLILITPKSKYKGVYSISKRTDSYFTTIHNKKKIKITKMKQPDVDVERLVWSEDDFYTEDGEFKYEDDINRYTFNEADEINYTYEPVAELVYSFNRLLDDNKTFETQDVKAKVNVDGSTPNIQNVFSGYVDNDNTDVVSFSHMKYIFPVNCDMFRIAGNETITVPAGTFNCVVIEGIRDFEEKVKIWIPEDKPGIPVKVIKDLNDGSFSHYYVYELKQVVNK